MTTEAPSSSRRAEALAGLRRSGPALGLVLLLAIAVLVPAPSDDQVLRMATSDRSRADGLRAVVANLPIEGLVLVAFDADLGTYAEIRGTTRAALADLAAHGLRLAFVSFTPEGRAIAAAELERLGRVATGTKPTDFGFMAGAEAALVRAISGVVPTAASGDVADAVRSAGGGLAAFDMVLIVSGSDLSARSWVEQVGARLPALPMVAIAPTFLDPELAPYLRSGQLTALVATLREGVAYAQAIPSRPGDDRGPIATPLPMLLGMLVALAVLAEAGARRLVRWGRGA